MGKKKNISKQNCDIMQDDLDYIEFKMNPSSQSSQGPVPYVDYDYQVKLKCRNQKQKEYYNLLKDDSKIIVSADGAPGSGKSFVSLAYALQVLRNRQFKKIICFVPTAPAGASSLQIGYLKGTYEDKIFPYVEADRLTMTKILEQSGNAQPEKIVDGLIRNNVIQHRILNYVRGATYDNSLLLLNEAENWSYQELLLILTRIGENSKICISGDVMQCDRQDIKKQKLTGLEAVITKLSDMEEFGHIHFNKEDIVRNPIITKILDRLQDQEY